MEFKGHMKVKDVGTIDELRCPVCHSKNVKIKNTKKGKVLICKSCTNHQNIV